MAVVFFYLLVVQNVFYEIILITACFIAPYLLFNQAWWHNICTACCLFTSLPLLCFLLFPAARWWGVSGEAWPGVSGVSQPQEGDRELSLNTQDRDKQTGQASRLADSGQPKTDHSQSFTWTNKSPVGRYVGFFVSKHFSKVFISQTWLTNTLISFYLECFRFQDVLSKDKLWLNKVDDDYLFWSVTVSECPCHTSGHKKCVANALTVTHHWQYRAESPSAPGDLVTNSDHNQLLTVWRHQQLPVFKMNKYV